MNIISTSGDLANVLSAYASDLPLDFAAHDAVGNLYPLSLNNDTQICKVIRDDKPDTLELRLIVKEPTLTPGEESERTLEGIEGGGAILVTEKSGAKYIALWDDEFYINYGSVDARTPRAAINNILRMINNAYDRGHDAGKEFKQREVAKVLGYDLPPVGDI